MLRKIQYLLHPVLLVAFIVTTFWCSDVCLWKEAKVCQESTCEADSNSSCEGEQDCTDHASLAPLDNISPEAKNRTEKSCPIEDEECAKKNCCLCLCQYYFDSSIDVSIEPTPNIGFKAVIKILPETITQPTSTPYLPPKVA